MSDTLREKIGEDNVEECAGTTRGLRCTDGSSGHSGGCCHPIRVHSLPQSFFHHGGFGMYIERSYSSNSFSVMTSHMRDDLTKITFTSLCERMG
jgi:hypothetical protein